MSTGKRFTEILVKFGCVVPLGICIVQTDRQTDRQTDSLQYFTEQFSLVKSYSWNENQISTKTEAKFDIGLLI